MEHSDTLKSNKAGLNPKFQIKHKVSVLKIKLLEVAVFSDVSKNAPTSKVTFATMGSHLSECSARLIGLPSFFAI